MKRPYLNNIDQQSQVDFFVGYEVEKTPAYKQKTLFVVGVQPVNTILEKFNEANCTHIFFGANHSYLVNEESEWFDWEDMIEFFLRKDILCSLDISVKNAIDFTESVLLEYNNFIPQLRVEIPYLKLWNYNTTIKLDDLSFNYSNPGVWCHHLHTLTNNNQLQVGQNIKMTK